MWKNRKRNYTTTELSDSREPSFQFYQEYKGGPERKPGKGKGLGLRCYGFLCDDGVFDCAKFAYGDNVYIPGSRLLSNDPGRFVNAKLESDWISVSTYKNSKLGRTEENISHTLCCFLDLDGPYTSELPDGEKVSLPLTDDIIRQRCFLLGLPMLLIIESSPGRFHVKFYFKCPVHNSKKKYLKLVQRALFDAFKDMGPDPVVTEDLTRFLRNENQVNSVNKKYPNKPAVVIREQGQLCTLSELYHALKQHGYVQLKAQGSTKPRRARQIPFHVSQHRILTFLQANNGIVTTYKELFSRCNVSESTGYLLISGLRASGKLTVETVRAGRTWKTRFTLKIDTLRKELINLCSRNTGIKKRVLDVVRRVSRVGLPVGVRNNGAFILRLGLQAVGFNENESLEHLHLGFLLSKYAGAHTFSEKEFKKTVSNASKAKYRYCNVFKNERWLTLLKGITNLECEILRTLDAGGESG